MSHRFDHFKLDWLPDGRVKIKCEGCYLVTRGGLRRAKRLLPNMHEAGEWVDDHECTPYRTLASAKRAQWEMAQARRAEAMMRDE